VLTAVPYLTWTVRVAPLIAISGRSGISQVWVMNADGSDQTELTSDKVGHVAVDWSPDGQAARLRRRQRRHTDGDLGNEPRRHREAAPHLRVEP
jgi:Tol biopolymer transport system component